MKIKKFNRLWLAAILIITACDNGGSSYSNNGSSEKYDYCLLAEQKECLVGPFELSTCSGQLSNSCPAGYYTGSQAKKPSSSSNIFGNNSSSSVGGGGYTGTYGSVTHGGQTYKTVVIGTQTWMAENLNYNASGSVYYNNNTANSTKYGRLYDWATAMTVCPTGWHLPSEDEWRKLTDYVGGRGRAGTKLKATNGWNTNNGSDDYGFAALPGGCRCESSFYGAGNNGNWWYASEGHSVEMHNDEAVEFAGSGKPLLFSVRCVQD